MMGPLSRLGAPPIRFRGQSPATITRHAPNPAFQLYTGPAQDVFFAGTATGKAPDPQAIMVTLNTGEQVPGRQVLTLRQLFRKLLDKGEVGQAILGHLYRLATDKDFQLDEAARELLQQLKLLKPDGTLDPVVAAVAKASFYETEEHFLWLDQPFNYSAEARTRIVSQVGAGDTMAAEIADNMSQYGEEGWNALTMALILDITGPRLSHAFFELADADEERLVKELQDPSPAFLAAVRGAAPVEEA